MNSNYTIEVGVDVSKKILAIDIDGKLKNVENTKSRINEWLRTLKKRRGTVRVTCESTGGYEDTLLKACLTLDIPVSQVNPLHIKSFIRSFGNKAKTDPIDAGYIRRYATERNPETLDKSWLKTHERRELQNYIDFLVKENSSRLCKLDKIDDATIKADLREAISATKASIREYQKRLQKLIQEDEELTRKQKILESVPGVGRKTTHALLNTLPELGKCNRKEIAALVGVAPMHNDSGNHKGKRITYGGRARPRTALYMACFVGLTWNPEIKRAYNNLRDRGKSHDVAMVAMIRKMLVHLNSLLKEEKKAII